MALTPAEEQNLISQRDDAIARIEKYDVEKASLIADHKTATDAATAKAAADLQAAIEPLNAQIVELNTAHALALQQKDADHTASLAVKAQEKQDALAAKDAEAATKATEHTTALAAKDAVIAAKTTALQAETSKVITYELESEIPTVKAKLKAKKIAELQKRRADHIAGKKAVEDELAAIG